MNHIEQIQAFERDLDSLVSRYCSEFELTTAAAIGVLQIKIHTLIAHATKEDDDEPEFPVNE